MPPNSYATAAEVLRHRFLGFLIWQLIQSTLIFTLSQTLLFTPFSAALLLKFICFLLSSSLFAVNVHSISTPKWERVSSLGELGVGVLRGLIGGGGVGRGVRVWGGVIRVVVAAGIAGGLGIVGVVGGGWEVGVRGVGVGVVYGVWFVARRRWVLVFPIVQRPPFFSFKMGISSAIRQSLSLSIGAYLFSGLLILLLPQRSTSQLGGRSFFTEQLVFLIGSFAVILSWELTQHLHKVLHTKRFTFAPPKGSAAAETNPTEPLLAALEESPPRSLLQYLAYLDLYMICGSNIDTWKRAAFFEDTGETYKRIIEALLRPLNQLASKMSEELTGSTSSISKQLCSPDDIRRNSEILETLNDFQLYSWCAQAAAALMAHSHKEDRFGVAQLSGSHAAVLSTLLSCLLVSETFMGKKTALQSPNYMSGPAGIRWATTSSGWREITTTSSKKRDSPSHSKAYSLADVFKISIYHIVAEFHEEMLRSAKEGLLEKDWLSSGEKPIYGSHDVLARKLQLFLGFQAG
ncbi:hypothetical protein AKJ16_DCAP03438 [Drosera capensis]